MRPSTTTSPAPTRRARQRAAAIGEIKALARRQLAEHGPGALSLRAIAREMGTASSALYRYFPGDHAGRWAAVCQAYRQWSLDHPSDFALIFGTPLPGYHAPEEVTAAAAGRSLGVAAGVFTAAVQAGAADPGRAQIPAGLKTGALWGALAGDSVLAAQPALAGIVLSAWASLLGYLVAEIFGSLPRLIASTDLLYQAHVRTVMLGMGFQPALVEVSPVADG